VKEGKRKNMRKRRTPENEFSCEFFPRSANESFARSVISAFVAQLDPDLEELTDIRTAVSEAVTNCIVHAYRESDGLVYISAKYYGDRTVVIRVRDKGCGISDIKTAMKPLYTTDTSGERGGMGFAIMQSFTDKLRVTSKEGKGTSITMTKKLKALHE